MATTEHTINDALAELLRATRKVWRVSNSVRSENTGMIKGASGKRPDILVVEPLVSPVVIETEVLPAGSVEQDAQARLGQKLRMTGQPILSAVAVRLPMRLREFHGADLTSELTNAVDIDMALYTGRTPADCSRWPTSGWLQGSVVDLSFLVQSATVPPAVIDAAADLLVDGVNEAAGFLDDIAEHYPGAVEKIGIELRQEDDPQTRRMAATILANAFVFHSSLARGPGDLQAVKTLDELRNRVGIITKGAILDEWRKILLVNYWPIFDIARRIMEVLPTQHSTNLIRSLASTAERLVASGLMRSHDLTGAVFQRLIVDRKYLAAFYTTPASAALLVGLALKKNRTPSGASWSDRNAVESLRIGDFACGTGTLLSIVYQHIGQLHEMVGGDAEEIHPKMMADVLVGCDVLPAAAHLTASMLAGAHPTTKYEGSSIYTMAYGKQPKGDVALGSLDLLRAQGKFEILDITSKALGATGSSEQQSAKVLPHYSFNLVIMNPPFTRPTNHEGRHENVPNPMFAAFGSDAEEQREMSKATRILTKGTSGHGNAGEASIFLALAHRKLRFGGTLALVMPVTLLSGSSWEASRRLLAKNYRNLVVATIAGADSHAMAFSADTGMGECLIVGDKTQFEESKRAVFVTLNQRPSYPLEGATIAEQVQLLASTQAIQRLEDGPSGGSPIKFGDDIIGRALDAPLPIAGGWNLARVSDLSLAQTAYQLVNNNRLWLPQQKESEAASVPITFVEDIAEVGPIDRDINGTNSDGTIRGPFALHPVSSGSAPTYPVLWGHDADRERTMTFEANWEGIPRTSTDSASVEINRKVEHIWGTATHCHCNRDFQFNSQSTAMQFTQIRTIGGTAWLSLILPNVESEKAMVAWANSTLGLLMYWWHASRQQSGRGRLTKTTLYTLPVLDITSLRPDQLTAAVALFDDMCEQPLKPVHQIADDPVRRELDERFVREVLDLPESFFEPLDLLRRKLSKEPSIHGGKKS